MVYNIEERAAAFLFFLKLLQKKMNQALSLYPPIALRRPVGVKYVFQLLVQKIQKNCSKNLKTAYFKCEFDSAFPGTVKIFAATCASSVS